MSVTPAETPPPTVSGCGGAFAGLLCVGAAVAAFAVNTSGPRNLQGTAGTAVFALASLTLAFKTWGRPGFAVGLVLGGGAAGAAYMFASMLTIRG